MNRLSRRALLRASAGSLLASGLWPGVLAAADRASEEFHFAVVNDLHYRNRDCNEWMTRVFGQIKGHKENVAFCLLVGDLSHNGRPDQLGPVRDHARTIGKPVYPVIGNHDYFADNGPGHYEKLFPGRINYPFVFGGWQFVGLDSTQSWKRDGTTIQPATLSWLKGHLRKLDKKKPTVLFTHFPLGPNVPWRPRKADAVLDHFKEFNLRAVYNGHRHELLERKVGNVPITTNRCCSRWCDNHRGPQTKGYFLCHARDGKVTHRFVAAS